ncbi:MAG: hypothetical protein FWE48_06570 [Coriobacteriia bacterium]|nr:hypothetical protein [Coriobacteriia bacterium]
MENLFNIDPAAYYSASDAFAYARLQPRFGVYQLPYSWGPLAIGAMIAGLIMGAAIYPMQKRLVQAELSMTKGRGYLSLAIMAVLSVAWIVFWSLNPWSNVTPFLALINVGALGLFVGVALLILGSLPFSNWKTVDAEAIKENVRAELGDDLDG